MGTPGRSILLACIAVSLSLTACSAGPAPDAPIIQGSLQDMVLDFSVKALHALVDPESLSPFSEPKFEVDCVSDQKRRDCCVATGTMDVDLPIPDFSGRIRDELLKAIRGELAQFEILNSREPTSARDMDWLVQLNEKIAEKLLKEWFSQDPKAQAVFQPLALTPDECEQIVADEIAQTFPAAFPQYYANALPTQAPFLLPTPKPFEWPECHLVPGVPFSSLVCEP